VRIRRTSYLTFQRVVVFMKNSVISIIALLTLMSGCGNSDEPAATTNQGQAGTSGTAGQAGMGTAGGQAGMMGTPGGQAGMGTAGSQAGSAGMSAAGSAGQSGQAGSGGATASAHEKFYEYLLGRFDSSEQAKTNQAYFPVQMQTCKVDMPALGTHVLYLEQALLSSLGAPYRQRLYVIEAQMPPETHARSRVFEFKDPTTMVGWCSKANPTSPTVDDVIERDGCQVLAELKDGVFVGGTMGKGCSSSLQGASYATSEVSVEMTKITSWDRGFDTNDMQVWGAVAGPYVFDRKN
jgi:CpeT protein